MNKEEIEAVENHISNIPAVGAMYAPVLIEWLKVALKEREELLRLAYFGEHYFPDLTWKARCEELLAENAERKEYAEQVERDWREAKSEFGTATAKLRDRVRNAEEIYVKAMAAIHEAAGIPGDGLAGILGWIEEAKATRSKIAEFLRTTSRAKGVLISIHSSQDIARLADDIEAGRY